MKRESVKDTIFSKSSYKDPIPVSEYLHLLKPEYVVTQHWEEPYHSENNSYEGHWVLNVIHERLETDDEFQARIDHVKQLKIIGTRNKLKKGSVGDFYFKKTYKNNIITECRMLRLESFVEETGEVRFQLDNASSNEYLVSTVKSIESEYEVDPGVILKTRLIGPLK